MLKINLSKDAARFLQKLPPKHGKQLAERLQTLMINPEALPSVELKGYAPYRRAASGEYRIIFYVADDTLFVPLIGKRNDDEVYQLLKRFLR
jgi:mRNA-degrading endonuclease RelE of RelBE toxin-antitoxin system